LIAYILREVRRPDAFSSHAAEGHAQN
jgi:hypothetical protein